MPTDYKQGAFLFVRILGERAPFGVIEMRARSCESLSILYGLAAKLVAFRVQFIAGRAPANARMQLLDPHLQTFCF